MLRFSLFAFLVALAQPDYEDALREVNLLEQEGRLEEALSLAAALIESSPHRKEGYFVLGDLYRRAWRPREAVEVFNRALEIDNTTAVVLHREIAATYAELRVWDAALEHLDLSLSLAPKDVPSLLAKAMALAQSGALEEALGLYQRLLYAAPQDATLHFRVGELKESTNRFDEAESAYRRALALEPDLQGARFRLGKLLSAAGRAREAERQLARAVTLAPEHAESRLELAKSLDALDRPARARRQFELALALDATLASAYIAYGNFVARQGDRDRARLLLGRFRELESMERRTAELFATVDFAPEDHHAKEELISLLLKNDRYPLALRMTQRFLLSDPTEERHYLLAASVYEAWGKSSDAKRLLEQARDVFPESKAVRRELEGRREK